MSIAVGVIVVIVLIYLALPPALEWTGNYSHTVDRGTRAALTALPPVPRVADRNAS